MQPQTWTRQADRKEGWPSSQSGSGGKAEAGATRGFGESVGALLSAPLTLAKDPALPLICCVTSGKLLPLSEPQGQSAPPGAPMGSHGRGSLGLDEKVLHQGAAHSNSKECWP